MKTYRLPMKNAGVNILCGFCTGKTTAAVAAAE
jgi:hypothetical protein